MDELRRSTVPLTSPEARPWPPPVHPLQAALIQDLQLLRKRLLERLEAIESMVRHRPVSSAVPREIAGLERALQAKQAELEETQSRLRAQSDRQETEWQAVLAQLEEDRRMLAEAWERVERQRIEILSTPQAHPPTQPQGTGARMTAASQRPHQTTSIPMPIRSPATDGNAITPVAQTLLRQFQTLCSDVRRNAEGRRA
jgi:hypothetical protein